MEDEMYTKEYRKCNQSVLDEWDMSVLRDALQHYLDNNGTKTHESACDILAALQRPDSVIIRKAKEHTA